MILERLPATLELCLLRRPVRAARSACRWASIPASIRATGSSRLLQAVSLIGVSLPTFLIGILLILIFAVLPATGCRRSAAARR